MSAPPPVPVYSAPDRRPQAASGLRVLFWSYIASLTFGVLSTVWWSLVPSFVGTSEALFKVSNALQTLVYLVIAAVTAFAYSRIGTAIEGRARVLTLAAAGTIGFRAVLSLGSLAVRMAELKLDGMFEVYWWVSATFAVVTSALVIAALMGAPRALGVRAPLSTLIPYAVLVLAGLVLDIVHLLWMNKPFDERPGMWTFHLQSAIDFLSTGLVAISAAMVRTRLVHALPASSAALSSARLPDAEWSEAASGVSLLRGSLVARVVVIGFAIPLGLVAASSRDLETIAVILCLVFLAMLIVSVVGLVGQVLYAHRVPERAGAKDFAWMSLAFTGLGLVFDVWTLVLVARMLSGRFSHASDFEEQSPWTTGGAMALAFIALALLIASFAQSARHLGVPRLVERARVVGGLLCGSGAVVALTRIIAGIDQSAAPVLILAPFAGIVALIGFFQFLGFLRELADTMRQGEPERAPEPAAPIQLAP